jgi:chemotaxis protein histidine kinase CheA
LKTIEALKEQLEETAAQLDEKRGNLYEANATIREAEDRKKEMEDTEEAREALKKDLEKLQEETEQLDKIRQEQAASEEAIQELEAQKQVLVPELADLTAKREAEEEKLKDLEELKKEQQQLEAELPLKRAERDQLQQQVADLRTEHEKLEEKLSAARKEQSEIRGEVEAKTSQRDALIKHIEALNSDVRNAGGADDGIDKLEDLWLPHFKERTDPGGDTTETGRLDFLLESMKDAGIQMSRRTVYSYHTALKSQDISPLTVLAGISGTGKSLLPKVYSDCMGIHFLNLAVQPGWNSPQDMFGFYNYIEQKYKGTTLARAMVQFDQYLDRGDRETDLHDQVLLVLLDEMNLARIEYYFSEMLSRLELRRVIDQNDPVRREDVAIPLEIGHAKDESETVSLFPGNNILFTGTMNEDESTQSLSDKVLDRACVLRFGKPDHYVTSPVKTDGISIPPPLSSDVWESWKPSPGTPDTELDNFVSKLGSLLFKVGSPFGHRVSQGIVRYVNLYPLHDSQSRKDAMADQIEQKILPKLRGKEVIAISSELDELQDIVRELQDDSLLAAIVSGRESGQGAFMWQGLDRSEVGLQQ